MNASLVRNVRPEPRFSVNAITEYLTAGASRRQTIVKEQREPDTFRVDYYEFARHAFAAFLVGNLSNKNLLLRQIDRLFRLSPNSDYEEVRNRCNIEAIERLLFLADEIELSGLQAIRTPTRQPKLTFDGVQISVWPEVLLNGCTKKDGSTVGGVLLVFSKNEERHLDEESARCPASLLFEFLSKRHPNQKVLHKATIVIDVFGERVFTAPRSYRRTMKDVAAACKEISLLWGQSF